MSTHGGRIILVTGTTGQQGGAVARNLLKKGWAIRALIRDLNKEAARKLADSGAQLVSGDFYNRASIDAALKGVYGVFSVQNFWLPDVGYEGEIKQGNLLADAAEAAGVQHFVYSSVGAAHRGMGQKHFESKWLIEQHVQKLRLPRTILRPVAFMENYNRQRAAISNGTFSGWGLLPEKTLQLIAVEDIGAFASIVFDKPKEFLGKTIELAGDELTEEQIAETLGRVTGRPVQLRPPQQSEGQQPTPEQMAMFHFFNGKGYDADISSLRKVYPELRTFEQYLRENGWKNLPTLPREKERAWR